MRWLKTMAWLFLLAVLAVIVPLLVFQPRLIYYPRAYERAALWDLEQREGRRIRFTTSQGSQVAFYLPPRADPSSEPAFVWIVCGGNGALALDYAGEPMHWDGRFGYLFVDYPGYGLSAGSPNPKSIEEATVAAAEAWRTELGWNDERLRQRVGVFGHSIGCAAVLMAADKLGLERAVLCSPFTTLTEMGRRVVGWPLCHLNMHRFDNVSRLRSLDERGARVRIFHGADDEIVPVAMSRELHALFPRTVSFTPVPDSGHNDVVMRARDDLGEAMMELSGLR